MRFIYFMLVCLLLPVSGICQSVFPTGLLAYGSAKVNTSRSILPKEASDTGKDVVQNTNEPVVVYADFGDAPESYGTTKAVNGPSHLIPSADPASAKVYFGNGVTIDGDGQSSKHADLDEDNGVTSFNYVPLSTSTPATPTYEVNINATNNSAVTAHIAGWIDFNRNNIFEPNERITTTIPASFSGKIVLSFPCSDYARNGLGFGLYARFRISTDVLTSPLGQVSDGEVEDYYIPALKILPAKIESFTAMKNGAASNLSWTTLTEINSLGFYLQRSTDGINFKDIAYIASKAQGGNSTQQISYNYDDKFPEKKLNIYRVKQKDIDGKIEYSTTGRVNFSNNTSILIYPNPVDDILNIEGLAGNENMVLINASGQVVRKEKVSASTTSISMEGLVRGSYSLIILGADGKKSVEKVVKK